MDREEEAPSKVAEKLERVKSSQSSSSDSDMDLVSNPSGPGEQGDSVDYSFEYSDRSELARNRLRPCRAARREQPRQMTLPARTPLLEWKLETRNSTRKIPSFDFFLWVRKFMRLLEDNGTKTRRSGFTFKDLNVSGRGAALQLQKNVGSGFMVPFRLKEQFGHPPEKEDLEEFPGFGPQW